MLHYGGEKKSPSSNVKQMAIGPKKKKKKKKGKKITPWTEQNPKALWTKSFLRAHSIVEMKRNIHLGSVGIVFGLACLPTGFHFIWQNSLSISQFFHESEDTIS